MTFISVPETSLINAPPTVISLPLRFNTPPETVFSIVPEFVNEELTVIVPVLERVLSALTGLNFSKVNTDKSKVNTDSSDYTIFTEKAIKENEALKESIKEEAENWVNNALDEPVNLN